MYKKLENDFKKESKYNKESRKFLIIYIVAALISISLKINFKLNILFMILILIILLFLFLTIKAAIFDRINILKKDGKINYITKVYNNELSLLKNILKKYNLYNEIIIKDFIEHYRKLIPQKINSVNVIEVLSIIITIIFGIYDIVISDDNKLYLIIIIIIFIVMITITYKEIKNTIILLKGEENIYERLEELLNTLYIEIINNNERKVQHKKRRK